MNSISINTVVALTVLIFAAPASGQWAKHPDSSVPRTRDGKPNLSVRAPKAPAGKPDLSGVWLPDPDPNGTPVGVEHVYFRDIS